VERLLIDIFGTAVGYFVVLLFFSTFWTRKKIKPLLFAVGLIFIAAINTAFTTFYINTVAVSLATLASMVAISLLFVSGISYKMLLSILITAILILSEIPAGIVLTQIVGVTAEQIPDTTWSYFIGVSTSRLLTFFIVCLIRLYWKNRKQELGRKFNSLMGFVAATPIMISFIVLGYIADFYVFRTPVFGIVTVLFSLLLVFVIMHVLSNQFTVMESEKKFDMAAARLETQVEHYQELYQAQSELRAIRHDLKNSLTSVSGVLRSGDTNGALNFIEKMTADVMSTAKIISTGLPAVDAVLNTKIACADESGLRIAFTVNVENEVLINQIDLGITVATALDNAIEGVLRSGRENEVVILDITSVSDYISIYVENAASAPVNGRFETSKDDKTNHGFGMKQMGSIAHKYNGTVQPEYKQETGKFYLKILMENKSG